MLSSSSNAPCGVTVRGIAGGGTSSDAPLQATLYPYLKIPTAKRSLGNGKWEAGLLIPIGYAPKWKPGFRRGHLTHEDALVLFERLGGRVLVPYHWGTFHHVTSRAHDAIVRLVARLKEHHLRSAVRILEPGETLELTRDADRMSSHPARRAVDRAFSGARETATDGDPRRGSGPRAPQ